METHTKLWTETSNAIGDFMEDMKEHGLEDDVLVLLWSEFGGGFVIIQQEPIMDRGVSLIVGVK
ncbi:MAG: hypothetical protein CM1200mP38_1610 [Dehalococcoidia bacterium]|nr:MAG: hypothetical protein CM1200mP38_1610 [Dehalococcoidia bacterium]